MGAQATSLTRPLKGTIRRLAVLAALVAGCGAAQVTRDADAAPAAPVPEGFGWLDMAAFEATIWPREMDSLGALAERWSAPLLGPVPPLAEAWARARQLWGDALSEPPVPGERGRTIWGRWGLSPTEPVRMVVAAVDGTGAGRTLIRVADALRDTSGEVEARQLRLDRALASAPPAVVHSRLLLQVDSGDALVEALRFHLGRRGFQIHEVGEPAPPFIAGLSLPADTILLARDPALGDLIVVRGRGSARAVDVLTAASPRSGLAALFALAISGDTSPPPLVAESRLALDFLGTGYLELSRSTAATLTALGGTGGVSGDRPAFLDAAADLSAACTERWRRLGRVAFGVALGWQADAPPHVDVWLTHRGRSAWAQAAGPAVLRPERVVDRPLSALWRLSRAGFIQALPDMAELPANPLELAVETSACAAGGPLSVGAALLAVAPALDVSDYFPSPVPANPDLMGKAPTVQGVTLLGYDVRGMERTPRLGVVTVGPPSAFPAGGEPLGDLANVEMTPTGPRYSAGVGALSVAYERRPLPDGAEMATLGLGDGALAEYSALLAPDAISDGPLAWLVADAPGLRGPADAPESGESAARAALDAWASLGLHLEMRADATEAGVRFVLAPRARLASPAGPR